MADEHEAINIDVKRDEGVTIEFADGRIARFSIMELRLGCPCATCRSLRDRDEAVWPRPNSPKPLRISDAELHGAWGLRIIWNDDHSTGIFPFDTLRTWSDD